MRISPGSHPYRQFFAAALLMVAVSSCNKGDGKEIFQDDFNSTSLDGAWIRNLPAGSDFSIVAGEAHPVAGGGTLGAMPSLIYREKITGGFKVGARFSIAGGTFTGRGYLVGRSQASDAPQRSYYCGYYYDTFWAKNYFMLGRYDATQLVDLAVRPMHNLTTGVSDMLSLSFDGGKIQCEISGHSSIILSANDSTYVEGYIGLTGGGYNADYLYFDDFRAERL